MIANYSPLIQLADKKYMLKQTRRDIQSLQKNVIKCNRRHKLSYCKLRGGKE